MNPDLTITDEASVIKHWNETGSKQWRLFHPDQLKVVNEFGLELVVYICYYYYLFKKGYLFNHVITTYPGMRCLYFFLPASQVKEEPRSRIYKAHHLRPYFPNRSEVAKDFDYRFWSPPPYKNHFKSLLDLKTKKPLLVIHNKFVKEWGKRPINFIFPQTLDFILHYLTHNFTVVYIRPIDKDSNRGFSTDKNTTVEGLRDFDLIRMKYPSVIVFSQLLKKFPKLSYNEVKLGVYAQCNRFIQVQGGGSFQSAFFGGKQLILHRKGPQLKNGCYQGWFRKCCNPGAKIKVVRTDYELVSNLGHLA